MESHLHWADYLILVGFLVISLSIGIYHSLTGGRQKTVAEFIMANRKLKVIPTAISLLVSFHTPALLLGYSAEIYSYGVQYSVICILAAPLAILSVERIIVPWLHPLQLVSVYDYLESRYMSKSVRIFGASLGILYWVIFMGVVMYVPSTALEAACGLPLSVAVPVMAVISVAYTVLGGMRAVIWTDVFQFLIMIGGMVAILVKGLLLVGGITNVFRLADEEGRLVWANVSVDPRERHTVWNIIVGVGITMTSMFGLSQPAVQRYSAIDKLSRAKIMVLLNIPPAIIMYMITGIIGLIVLAYYSSIKCDPLANKDIANPNMLLPHFVVSIFADSPGFAGLFLASLYGAALSTVSSTLSSSAANCWEDMLKWKLDYLPETKKVLINRILVVLLGASATAVAFLAASVSSPIIQVMLAVGSSLIGPTTAIFFLGGISKHANWKGVLLGGTVGVSITLWLSIGSLTTRHIHPPLPPLSVEQCPVGNGNSTVFPSSLNDTDSKAFEVLYGIGDKDNSWNVTTAVVLPGSKRQVTQLRGLDNFYAMSYLWLTPFGAIVTGIIGMIASIAMRDKDLEAKVDERLLIRFHCCIRSDENENQEQLEDGNKVALHDSESRRLDAKKSVQQDSQC